MIIKTNAKDFKSAVKKVTPFVSQNTDMRSLINIQISVIKMEGSNYLQLVATNSWQLIRHCIPCTVIESVGPKVALVAAKATHRGSKEDVLTAGIVDTTGSFDWRHDYYVAFNWHSITLAPFGTLEKIVKIPCHDGSFPNYELLFPDSRDTISLTVPDTLAEIVSRVADKKRQYGIQGVEPVAISKNNDEWNVTGNANDKANPLWYQAHIPATANQAEVIEQTGYNPWYLYTCLDAVKEYPFASFNWVSPSKPLTISGESPGTAPKTLTLLMPMHLV